MSWKRGTGSVEVELSNVQSWIEAADPDLYGNGEPGVIRLFHDDRAIRADHEKAATTKQNNRMLACAIFAAIPVLIELGKAFHWIPQ